MSEKKFWRRVSDDAIVFCEVYGEPDTLGQYKMIYDLDDFAIQTAATIELNAMRKKTEAILEYIRDVQVADVSYLDHGKYSAELTTGGNRIGAYQQPALMPGEEIIIGRAPTVPYSLGEMTIKNVAFGDNKREVSIPIKAGDDIRIDPECNVYINGEKI